MDTQIRALWIDDSSADYNRLLGIIQRAYPAVQLERVVDSEAFERAIREGNFTLVLTEHTLDWSDGITVLRRIKARHPHRPVIMFTKRADLSVAIEAMKDGLDDYVLKSPEGYLRLNETIKFALEKPPPSEAVIDAAALQRYTSRLNILREIDQAILGSQSPEAIAKATLQRIQQLIPCRRGSVAVFELEDNRAILFATYGQVKTGLGTGSLFSQDAFGDIDALQGGQPVVVDDIRSLPSPSPWAQTLVENGIHSYVKIPLLSQEDLLGSLNLEADEPGTFTSEHLESAFEVANSLSIAIRQAKLTEQVRRLAITDELTGLYNRRHFFELGKREFERARRYNRPLSAIMADIDRFKRVNDTYGHATGDQVLKAVANRCKRAIRDIDVLGRYGGEEFAFLLPETNLSEGQLVGERLRYEVGKKPFPTDRESLPITISLGVASISEKVHSLENLLEHADAAMYAAKQMGRNRVMVMEK